MPATLSRHERSAESPLKVPRGWEKFDPARYDDASGLGRKWPSARHEATDSRIVDANASLVLEQDITKMEFVSVIPEIRDREVIDVASSRTVCRIDNTSGEILEFRQPDGVFTTSRSNKTADVQMFVYVPALAAPVDGAADHLWVGYEFRPLEEFDSHLEDLVTTQAAANLYATQNACAQQSIA